MTQDTNLVRLIERFGSEDRCRTYLEELRWPSGPECPRCEVVTTVSRLASRNQFECDKCRYQFSVTAGTLFHDSHLPLWKWFLAVYLVCESKKGVRAKQLQRMLKVSYKTAWLLSHRIRDAMGGDEQPLLSGTVELDEAFVGGKRKGFGGGHIDNVVIAGATERANSRDNPFLFRDTLLVLLHGGALPYKLLIERDDPGERQRENDAFMGREAKRQAQRAR